jgi:hypothetical protein
MPCRAEIKREDFKTSIRRSMKTATRTIAVAVLVVVGALLLVHVRLLSEAYGDGAPYYGRTTNMDKWSSPWPALATLDAFAVAALVAWRVGRRRVR